MGRGTWKWPVRRFEMDGNISVRWDNSVVNGEARVGCGSYFCWLKRGKVGWGDVSQIIHKGKEMKPPTIISFPNHSEGKMNRISTGIALKIFKQSKKRQKISRGDS